MKTKSMENLFQTKMNEVPEPMHLDQEWLKLDSKLDAKDFLAFKWNKFNVYYLAPFVLGTCLSVFSLGLHFMKDDFQQTHFYHIDTVYVSRTIHDTIYLNKKSIQTDQKRMLSTPIENQKTENQISEAIEIQEVKSEQKELEKAPTQVAKLPVLKIKQDTIYKYDSVKISKKQWKKMKKQ